jgi:hypothetical protein
MATFFPPRSPSQVPLSQPPVKGRDVRRDRESVSDRSDTSTGEKSRIEKDRRKIDETSSLLSGMAY